MTGERYSRQELFSPIGRAGQEKIRSARVLVMGCGGLGSHGASLLARAGVGLLRIVDRDFVELSNLQRQELFEEADAAGPIPKAVAAARRIRAINSEVQVEPVVADVDPGSVLSLLDGVDLVLDGLDNFEGRYVLNDACVQRGRPWVYGACVGSTAMATLVVPGETPCLRCLHRELPEPGAGDTCDRVGLIGPAAALAAALQVAMALRYLVERKAPPVATLICSDLWDLRTERLVLPPRDALACPCCALRRFDFLEASHRSATALCGREAVQVRALSAHPPDLAALAERLRGLGTVRSNEFLLRLVVPPYELTLFQDGRAIVKGTGDEALARSLVSRWIGV